MKEYMLQTENILVFALSTSVNAYSMSCAGTKTITFTFKAEYVTETFTLKDFTVTTLTDAEYDGIANSIAVTKSIDVTIKKNRKTY